MTVTLEEAKVSLEQMLARAEAGEEVLIGPDAAHPLVKLVPICGKPSRLTRHPDLAGSTTTHEPAALINPLPPKEWGDLGTR
jgi:antitoxin (DNA-binding transcriptional repressor) of toxin-antitoxin stability system